MLSVCCARRFVQAVLLSAAVAIIGGAAVVAAEPEASPRDSDAEAKSEKEMKPYKQQVSGMDGSFEMVPIPSGVFTMGSPDDEDDREEHEGPQVRVQIEPFWMGRHEVTWDEYDTFLFSLDIQRRKILGGEATKFDELADAVTRPTKPYTDMTFGMGQSGYPAICMTQLAARMYCKWLSAKTGHFYRLPTEAEWEYACRAGTTTAYHFGDGPDRLDEYAWHYENSDEKYQKVGKKKPNPWGLYDIHGNVAEWVHDQYDENAYAKFKKQGEPAKFPVIVPKKEYSHIVRGGSWDDDPDLLRSAARVASSDDWKIQDPQIPQSVWYFTDALHVGFRIVRPLKVPTEEEIHKYRLWPTDEELDELGARRGRLADD